MSTGNARIDALIEKGDVNFAKDLKASEPPVRSAREWYESCGYFTADYPGSVYADGTPTDIHDFGLLYPVEVKRRMWDFHSVAGLSRGKKGGKIGDRAMLVMDMEYHLDRNMRFYQSLPDRYWIWNEDLSGCVWLDVRRTIKWWRCRWLKSYGRWRTVVTCPIFWNPRTEEPVWSRAELADFRCGYGAWPGTIEGLLYMSETQLTEYSQKKVAAKRRAWEAVEKRWINEEGEVQETKPPMPESR